MNHKRIFTISGELNLAEVVHLKKGKFYTAKYVRKQPAPSEEIF